VGFGRTGVRVTDGIQVLYEDDCSHKSTRNSQEYEDRGQRSSHHREDI
jgi:hypothetical protein